MDLPLPCLDAQGACPILWGGMPFFPVPSIPFPTITGQGPQISFDYHKLTGSRPEQRTVHPYHVGEIGHGWYLLAYDPARKAVRTFALQRITNLSMLKTHFVRDPLFNERDHLGVALASGAMRERKSASSRCTSALNAMLPAWPVSASGTSRKPFGRSSPTAL